MTNTENTKVSTNESTEAKKNAVERIFIAVVLKNGDTVLRQNGKENLERQRLLYSANDGARVYKVRGYDIHNAFENLKNVDSNAKNLLLKREHAPKDKVVEFDFDELDED